MSVYTHRRRRSGRVRQAAAVLVTAAVAIAAMPAAVAVARPAAGGPAAPVLGGLTSQGLAVVVMPSANGRKLARVEITLAMSCTSGGQWVTGDGGANFRLARGGAVRVNATIPPSQSAGVLGGTDVFSGRLHRKAQTFTGSWRLQIDFSLTGGKTDHCDSGPVTFTARL